ncbi:MAG: DNA polymerase IV [Neomegalonema sp.]|nr:DNA polymerase IV [Neomegalonema sp.]
MAASRSGGALCRDCLLALSVLPPNRRCPSCHSPRLIAHDELFDLSMAHIDCDAFYASVEKRDDPSLADKPVIIGGGTRGVVATCCYLARIRGVRSAMPMFKARKLCPEAVIIKPNGAKYVAVSRQIRSKLDQLTPLVEPLSLDEAFLDLSGTRRVHGMSPAQVLARLAREIEQEIGVSISVGLAPNKFLAKIASDLDKPRGYAVIGAAEKVAFLAAQPVRLIWGVGAATAERLERDGFRMISDLQNDSLEGLIRRYGALGQRLFRLAWGEDARVVEPKRSAKSVSAETTFDSDLSDIDLLQARLWPLCEKVSQRMKASGLVGKVVTLKLKTPDFRSRTRRLTLSTPSGLAEVLYQKSVSMLRKEALGGQHFRLIGTGYSDLAPAGEAPDLLEVVDKSQIDQERAERLIDAIRDRFGPDAIKKGRFWN